MPRKSKKAKRKPSAGLTKKQKSNAVKQARKGKDFGKKGKNFDKLVKELMRKGYSEAQAKKIAGAQFWKQVKKSKGGKK